MTDYKTRFNQAFSSQDRRHSTGCADDNTDPLALRFGDEFAPGNAFLNSTVISLVGSPTFDIS